MASQYFSGTNFKLSGTYKFWLLTIPSHLFMPFLPKGVAHIQGQLEMGSETGYLHWQLVVTLESKQRLSAIKRIFGDCPHCEPTKSDAARNYVFKDETRVDGTQFELGELPMRRNEKKDWDMVFLIAYLDQNYGSTRENQ